MSIGTLSPISRVIMVDRILSSLRHHPVSLMFDFSFLIFTYKQSSVYLCYCFFFDLSIYHKYLAISRSVFFLIFINIYIENVADLQQRSSPDRDIRLWLFYFVCASTDRSTTTLSEIHSRFFSLYSSVSYSFHYSLVSSSHFSISIILSHVFLPNISPILSILPL